MTVTLRSRRALAGVLAGLCAVGAAQAIGSRTALAQQAATGQMRVTGPTIDGNGVKSFTAISEFQGPKPIIIRVLEPSSPSSSLPGRFLYVLPVDPGVATLNSGYSDGLEELRLLDVPNRFNLTLIAPSYNIAPWYGDHDRDPTRRQESFVVRDLVPFGDSLAPAGSTPTRWLIGFSKSGFGALSLILRYPDVFDEAAAWDAPAQMATVTAALAQNFSSEANLDEYEIPRLVSRQANLFRARPRIWISGDDAAFSHHMVPLHAQLDAAGIPHMWAQGGKRDHSWDSGWLEPAVKALVEMAQ